MFEHLARPRKRNHNRHAANRGGRWYSFLLGAALALILAGCIEQRSPEELAGSLIYGFDENFITFDPARQRYAQESAIIMQVLEGLTRWNPDLEIEPRLATSWETPDNCQTWIFHLREGVTFHDGTPFTAHAVKAHFDRVQDPRTGSTRASRIADVVETEVVDDHTVVFHLIAPNSVFPEIMASTFATIPSPAAVERWGDAISRNPVGTGPFRFVEWVPDVRIVLEKNDDYWRAEDFHIRRLEFRPIRENTTRLILLEHGVIDMADVFFAHVRIAETSDDIVLQTAPQLSIRYIGFNTQKPPFDNKLVRQAANYAINKRDIVDFVFFGVGEPATGPLPSILHDYNPNIRKYYYDPDKARDLLAEAGYPDGFRAVMWTTESGVYRSTADAVVEYLRAVGIDVDMKILDNAVYWDRFLEYRTRDGQLFPTREGVFDIFLGGWVGGEAAHSYLESLFHSQSSSNSSFYDNPEVDALIAEYKVRETVEGRREVYHRLQEIIVEEAPWIFAFHGQINVAHQQRVRNFRVSNAGWLFFDHVELVDDDEAGPDAMVAHAEENP